MVLEDYTDHDEMVNEGSADGEGSAPTGAATPLTSTHTRVSRAPYLGCTKMEAVSGLPIRYLNKWVTYFRYRLAQGL